MIAIYNESNENINEINVISILFTILIWRKESDDNVFVAA